LLSYYAASSAITRLTPLFSDTADLTSFFSILLLSYYYALPRLSPAASDTTYLPSSSSCGCQQPDESSNILSSVNMPLVAQAAIRLFSSIGYFD
jgi:hypothetical protein